MLGVAGAVPLSPPVWCQYTRAEIRGDEVSVLWIVRMHFSVCSDRGRWQTAQARVAKTAGKHIHL